MKSDPTKMDAFDSTDPKYYWSMVLCTLYDTPRPSHLRMDRKGSSSASKHVAAKKNQICKRNTAKRKVRCTVQKLKRCFISCSFFQWCMMLLSES